MSGPATDPPETEGVNQRTADLDRLCAARLVARVFEEDRAVLDACAAVAREVGRVAEHAAEAIAAGGRMIYVGAGSSGRLGVLDASELPPTFGIDAATVPAVIAGGPEAMFRAREGAEDSEDGGRAAMADLAVGPGDVVVGIAASGRTPFTLAALDESRRRGARTALITSDAAVDPSTADVVVTLATGPEVLAGSTRMKAGTATKMTLNALSLAVMVRLGKVHGNRMVDLRAGSEKLRARALGLVRELGGVSDERARALLDAADGHAKCAILMARIGCTAAVARERLDAAGGLLRDALGEE